MGAGGRGGEEERRGSGGGQGDGRWQTAGYWQWLENIHVYLSHGKPYYQRCQQGENLAKCYTQLISHQKSCTMYAYHMARHARKLNYSKELPDTCITYMYVHLP